MNGYFIRLVSLGMLFLSLAGCSRRQPPPAAPANLITKNDFEAVQGWMPDQPSLTREEAHSGRYSLQVGHRAEYGMVYKTLLSDAGCAPGSRIRVSGWGRRSSLVCRAAVVVQVIDPAQNPVSLSWHTIDLHAIIKTTNYWTPFHEEFDIPASAGPQAQLQVYFWRTGAEHTTYLDDLEISRI